MESLDNLFDALLRLLNPIMGAASDYIGQVGYPYAVITEGGETLTHFTRAESPRPTMAEGTFTLSIYAIDREQAKALGAQAASVLDDPDVTFTDGHLMACWPTAQVFIPEPDPGQSSPSVFHRAVTFSYAVQRSL